jgi:hypothetical protein
MASAVDTGTIDYHADAADQCSSFAMSSNCTVANHWTMLDICYSAFMGNLAEGDACHVAQECAGNANCVGDCSGSSCCLGKCGPPQPKTTRPMETKVPDGGSCYEPSDCELMTSHCEPKSSTCHPRLAVGVKCKLEGMWESDPCVEYAICRGGVCEKKPEPGETCLGEPDYPAASSCQVGGCDPSTNKCTVTTAIIRCF